MANSCIGLNNISFPVVFDHLYKKAYACISSRTNPHLLKMVCQYLGYDPVPFEAFDQNNKLIYHTNVMMWIGTTVAAICADAIKDSKTMVNKINHFTKFSIIAVLLS